MKRRPATTLPRTVPAGSMRRTLEAVQRFRSNFVFGSLLLLFVLLLGRLGTLQLAQASTFRAEADRRHVGSHTFRALRGRILDVHGRLLAASRPVRTVLVDPRAGVVEDVDGFAIRLAMLLDDDAVAPRIRAKILEERKRKAPRGGIVLFAGLEDRRILDRLDLARTGPTARELGLYGLVVEDADRRFFPEWLYAAHVLGQAPADPEKGGGTGVEGALDAVLSGEAVQTAVFRDGRRRLLADERVDRETLEGRDVRLTIDVVVQHFLETALDRVDAEWRPVGARSIEAVGIVLDPTSGEIVAMASRPSFDPHRDVADINRAVQGVYEPGSAFKPFTVAHALSVGVTTLDETMAMPREATFPGVPEPVHDAHDIGQGDVVRLLAESSNTAAGELAYRLGPTGMKGLFERLALDAAPGVGLPGERGGRRDDPRAWRPGQVVRGGFGQGFGVTPLQLACWFAAFARDDGRIVRPTLLPGRGGARADVEPFVSRPDILAAVRRGLAECVQTGTASETVGGGPYPIAGKTGTAQNPPTDVLNCTFCGYAPRERPRVVVLVMARATRDETRHTSGAKVAGPAVRAVVDRTLAYWKVAPTAAPSREAP